MFVPQVGRRQHFRVMLSNILRLVGLRELDLCKKGNHSAFNKIGNSGAAYVGQLKSLRVLDLSKLTIYYLGVINRA